MPPNRLTRDLALVGGLSVGNGGTQLKNIWSGTVSINPASIAATTRAATTFSVPGAAVGDVIVLNPPATLNDDLIFCGAAVTATDTATVYLYNPTAGAIDDVALTWTYLVFDRT